MDSKTRYERVVESVRQQTGGGQSALVSEPSVRVVACSHGSLDPHEFKRSLEAAVQNDDLLRWQGQLAVAEPEPLRAVVAEEVEADHTRKALVGQCNTLLQALDSDR